MSLKKLFLLTVTFLSGISLYAVETVKVAYYLSNNFTEGGADSILKSGYAYEYLQEVASYTGWKYDYVYGDWSVLYEKFMSGEIDLMPGFSKTPEREKNSRFPEIPMGTESYYLYKLSTNYSIESYELDSFNGRRIGAIKNNIFTDYLYSWIKKNNVDCKVVLYESFEERDRALAEHKIDMLVTTNNNVSSTSGWSPVQKVGESSYYLGVSKNREDLLSQLNYALTKILENKPFLIQSLQTKYFKHTAVNSSLTSAEQEWMYSHKKLVIGYVNNYMPFCFTGDDGRLSGVITDIAKDFFISFRLADRVRMELRGFDTYEEMISQLQSGNIDIAFPVYDSFWHSEQAEIMQTDSFANVIMDMLYLDTENEKGSVTEKIAVAKDDYYQLIYTQINFPDSEILYVDSEEDCLKAVLSGDASSTILNSFKCIYYLGSRKYSKIKSFQLSNGISYSLGVKAGNTVLLALMNRALLLLDKDTLMNALYNYSGSQVYISFADAILNNMNQIIFILVIFLAVIIMAVTSYLTVLKSSNKKIKIVDAHLKTQLEIVDALSRDYINVYTVDAEEKTCSIIKMEGYVTLGFEQDFEKKYPYEKMCRQYISDRVFEDDREKMIHAMELDGVLNQLKDKSEYAYSYRISENGKIHYYQFKFIKLENGKLDTKLIVGFQNIDGIIAAAKERESLIRLSETDLMTKILNRGSGERLVTEALNRGERGLFCLLDVDHFKTINDKFGHSVGDKVLIAVAESLKNSFRDSDIVFRLGGDEFAVFAPGINDRDKAREHINQFFDALDKISISEMGSHKVSASMGAIISTEEYEVDFQTLYKLVDVCVYDSKEVNGNAVNFFPAE